jgi:hypothetical protein
VKLASIAREIDKRAESRPIGRLQELRKEIKGLKRLPTHHIFSSQTIFEDKGYAYHAGARGRAELQFNIGFEPADRPKSFMHGVAFSLEPSQTLPDPEVVLSPKVDRFNDFLRCYPQEFSDLRMWHNAEGTPSSNYPPTPISDDLVKRYVFIFLGRWQPVGKINYELVLDDFGRLLSLYRFVEGTAARPAVPETTGRFQFKPGCTVKRAATTATMAKGQLNVNLRHNEIQWGLHKHLASLYGSRAVGTECSSGTGGKVDVIVRRGDQFWFYDIKTAPTARACIREALAQLLEYSFWPGGREAKRLVVVGEPFLDGDSQVFLARLKKQFSLPISYQQFDMSKGKFVGTEQ